MKWKIKNKSSLLFALITIVLHLFVVSSFSQISFSDVTGAAVKKLSDQKKLDKQSKQLKKGGAGGNFENIGDTAQIGRYPECRYVVYDDLIGINTNNDREIFELHTYKSIFLNYDHFIQQELVSKMQDIGIFSPNLYNTFLSQTLSLPAFVDSIEISSISVPSPEDWTPIILGTEMNTPPQVFGDIWSIMLQTTAILNLDIILTNNQHFRIEGLVPIEIYFRYEGYYSGNFNFLDDAGIFAGNGKNFYSTYTYLPSPNYPTQTPGLAIGLPSLSNMVVIQITNNGEQIEPPQAVVNTLTTLYSSYVSGLPSFSRLVFSIDEATSVLSEGDILSLKQKVVDVSGILRTRQILYNTGSYSSKDNLFVPRVRVAQYSYSSENENLHYTFGHAVLVCDRARYQLLPDYPPHTSYVENNEITLGNDEARCYHTPENDPYARHVYFLPLSVPSAYRESCHDTDTVNSFRCRYILSGQEYYYVENQLRACPTGTTCQNGACV